MNVSEAWKKLEQTVRDEEIEEFKKGIQILVKADPELSYLDIEKHLRDKSLRLYLIALVTSHELSP